MTVSSRFEILDIVVSADSGPYADCADATGQYRALIGERIAPGFTAKTQRVVGGVCGCTHVSELLNRMTTVAFQTIAPLLAREMRVGTPDRLKNSCFAYRADGPLFAADAAEPSLDAVRK